MSNNSTWTEAEQKHTKGLLNKGSMGIIGTCTDVVADSTWDTRSFSKKTDTPPLLQIASLFHSSHQSSKLWSAANCSGRSGAKQHQITSQEAKWERRPKCRKTPISLRIRTWVPFRSHEPTLAKSCMGVGWSWAPWWRRRAKHKRKGGYGGEESEGERSELLYMGQVQVHNAWTSPGLVVPYRPPWVIYFFWNPPSTVVLMPSPKCL